MEKPRNPGREQIHSQAVQRTPNLRALSSEEAMSVATAADTMAERRVQRLSQ